MSKMYLEAGVNLDEAEKLNLLLKKSLNTKNMGLFAGKTELKQYGISLLNCCDGIGSKIIPLYERKMYKEISIDLVAANLNDMATQNAKAVSFSDYIAVHKLDSYAVFNIINELEQELSKYSCELLGGETSEIPHLLKEGTIDICGFAIGISKLYKAEEIYAGDVVIGLVSSGIHANGFTLIRKLYAQGKLSQNEFEETLTPAYVYYNEIRKLWDHGLIKSAANITGGGIYENLMRSIPLGFNLNLSFENIPTQMIYKRLYDLAGDEIFRVFNCGVGFCIVASEDNAKQIFEICRKFRPFILGKVEAKK